MKMATPTTTKASLPLNMSPGMINLKLTKNNVKHSIGYGFKN